MPPMDLKDWWLAAAAATSVASSHVYGMPQAGERVGVATAARQNIRSLSADRVVYVGNDIAFGERLETDSKGALHILFRDQSSITLGPNSSLTINELVYDPDRKQGHLKVNLLKGVARVVGGAISKYSDTRVVTNNATIGIRGGITIVDARERETRGVFLFGRHMEMTSLDGQQRRTVTRPGFGLSLGQDGLSEPFRVPVGELQTFLVGFEERSSVTSQGEAFTPRGQLVSTMDNPAGTNRPRRAIAPDRLDQVLDDINSLDPRTGLRQVLGTAVDPIQS